MESTVIIQLEKLKTSLGFQEIEFVQHVEGGLEVLVPVIHEGML